MKPHIVILDHFALFLYIRPNIKVKFYGCTNCKLRRYFRSSDLVIYVSNRRQTECNQTCLNYRGAKEKKTRSVLNSCRPHPQCLAFYQLLHTLLVINNGSQD